MKTNDRLPPRYLCKIERKAYTKRILFWLFRRYILNEDYFTVSRRFTGPRPRGTSQVSTTKTNATAFRYYIDKRKTVAFAEKMDAEDRSRKWRMAEAAIVPKVSDARSLRVAS